MSIQAVDDLTTAAPPKTDALVYKIGDITCDFSNNYLDDGANTHWMMLKEAQVLLALVRAYPNPVKPMELHQNIWQTGQLNESLIDKVIINLREKLNDLESEIIRKVPEFGYVLTMAPKPVMHAATFVEPSINSFDEIYRHPKPTADLSIFKQIGVYALVPVMMGIAFKLGAFTYDQILGYSETAKWITLSQEITPEEIESLKAHYSSGDTLFIDKTREGRLVVCSQPNNLQGIACTER
ncbi:winged helix-turn-helix domain-containing protein [Thaumasiovibrio subtropicus]|uniref:winged helix-turn-helix domain-containing protein n=1 Tax=Thaumasiovibrio subtropicus TaxID=1891207 RepID=UPI00131D8645|nr:winged helix-turn-helix domain-containing protein [Thaumasiovibrio subtropicus]